MIVLENVEMAIPIDKTKRKTILSRTNLVIPTNRRIALLGPSNENNRALVNLICGVSMPRSGRVLRMAKVSFPVGHLGGFEHRLAVRTNIAHLARLYDVDVKTLVSFVRNVSGLGPAFDEPFKALSGAQRKLLAGVFAYGIPFDVYVLTDDLARAKQGRDDVILGLFEARARTAGMIIPTRFRQFALDKCDMGLVLKDGKLELYEDIKAAVATMRRGGGGAADQETDEPEEDARNDDREDRGF
jgi:capsular polysaccharide transport system ATP-binding protein